MLKPNEKIEQLFDDIEDIKKVQGLPRSFAVFLDHLGEIVRDQQRTIHRLDRTLGNL